jgi:hypothetical protein
MNFLKHIVNVVTIDQDKHLESESKYPYMRTVVQSSQQHGRSQEEDTATGSPSIMNINPSLTNMLAAARHDRFQTSDQRAQDGSRLDRYHPVSPNYCAFVQTAIRITILPKHDCFRDDLRVGDPCCAATL